MNSTKYPRTEKAMQEKNMSLEELYPWSGIELKRLHLDDPGG